MEVLVPTVSDAIFKYTWPIGRYRRAISKKQSLDSPSFDLNVNGIRSSWNLSIRFWKTPDGKRITNPVVLCLNIRNCAIEQVERVKVRFQFAVLNVETDNWEYQGPNHALLELHASSNVVSLGYKDLSVVDNRHLTKKTGELRLMVKVQIAQRETEKHALTVDIAKLLKHPHAADTKLICTSGEDQNLEIPVHSCVIAARSQVLANMIEPLDDAKEEDKEEEGKGEKTTNSPSTTDCPKNLEVFGLSAKVAKELLRYIYSDHVDNLDKLAPQLLSLSLRFHLKGLKEICERNLIDTITPENIATRLLLADKFGCDLLMKAGLSYCWENSMRISKNCAWRMMEEIKPDLFNEVCEASTKNCRFTNLCR
ncbi:protein roadkill [Copidosoma floridanum]|uniref:protein roadkill n=1 Tax=Copidosoma floridanum TaxID=29053 RepID=UPI000C6F9A22|nr:protein roadkill [Copidosoma floridanum]